MFSLDNSPLTLGVIVSSWATLTTEVEDAARALLKLVVVKIASSVISYLS